VSGTNKDMRMRGFYMMESIHRFLILKISKNRDFLVDFTYSSLYYFGSHKSMMSSRGKAWAFFCVLIS